MFNQGVELPLRPFNYAPARDRSGAITGQMPPQANLELQTEPSQAKPNQTKPGPLQESSKAPWEESLNAVSTCKAPSGLCKDSITNSQVQTEKDLNKKDLLRLVE